MSFEWDERKQLCNIETHGVDFVRAAKIFRSPVYEALDDREDYGEDRLIAIGHVETNFYVVVYTWRENTRRIISAWKANKHDRREFKKNIG